MSKPQAIEHRQETGMRDALRRTYVGLREMVGEWNSGSEDPGCQWYRWG
jgi:hypothetical protein